MNGRKIEQLNEFMAEAVDFTEEFAIMQEIRIPMRVIEFNSESKWLFEDATEGVEHIDWTPLRVKQNCHTDTAQAINLARSIMYRKVLGERNFHPVVVLVSDGLSDNMRGTIEAIEDLKHSLNGKVARLSVCVEGAYEKELVIFATKVSDHPLVIKAEEHELFRRFLRSSIVHPRITAVWPEEYYSAITVTGGDEEADNWLEEADD